MPQRFDRIEARLGEETDVVTKEMYDFVDKGDRHVALRPEGTASVVRLLKSSTTARLRDVGALRHAFQPGAER